jgi:hypothetical protein
MSWQGNHDILIDRFDVRAHLDFIPENTSKEDEEEEISQEERYINYERYRILAQNDFLGGEIKPSVIQVISLTIECWSAYVLTTNMKYLNFLESVGHKKSLNIHEDVKFANKI